MKKTLIFNSFTCLTVLFVILVSAQSCKKHDPGDIVPTIRNLVVSFETDGGSAIPNCIVGEEGEYARFPLSPFKTGYAFEGWYTGDDYATPFDFGSTRVFNDMKVYAKYVTADENEVKFNFDASQNTLGALKDEFKGTMDHVTVPSSIGGVPVYNITAWANFQNPFTKSLVIPEPVANVGGDAYNANTSLASVNMANSVLTIGANAFNGCTNLEVVNIGDQLKTVDGGAFAYCSKLRRIDLPNTCTTLAAYAFMNAHLGDSVGLGNGMQDIQDAALQGIKASFVVLPATMKTIGNGALALGLKTIVMRSTDPESVVLGPNCFLNTTGVTIKVPASALSAYQSSAQWAIYNAAPNQIIAE